MQQDQTTSSLPSSSERSSSSAPETDQDAREAMESDEEIRRVPEVGLELAGPSTSGREKQTAAGTAAAGAAGTSSSAAQAAVARRSGRSPADKEHRRLKRLLRNRVSAQQARERKKAYLSELEVRVKDLEKRNSELEERLSTLQNENQMLRQLSTQAAFLPLFYGCCTILPWNPAIIEKKEGSTDHRAHSMHSLEVAVVP